MPFKINFVPIPKILVLREILVLVFPKDDAVKQGSQTPGPLNLIYFLMM